ncbi:hypothetical protein DB88DRAFT_489076 [Papiliotrema laurentii]|uniref:UDP-galactose transporter n=1 Tax=Papiliotrema laurentii TaxID=5418 RepID=A0AAD9D0U7_PAPLA|nr:hypothetical protein DB88DRAFT_489076 [Papiliotrema laurentii]
MSGSSKTLRRPTVSGNVGTRATSGGFTSPIATSPTARRFPGSQDDGGLMMREKERDDNSVGKAGAVERGVTRPKRRLSSLPTLPHPFHGDSNNRATSNASPPTSPKGPTFPNSSYHALQHPLTGATNAYKPPTRVEERSTMPASANKEGSPTLWGIELKWISLITLALQNAFLTIIMHYSRITTAPNKTYSAAAAVLLNELLKGSVSVIIALKRIDVEMKDTATQNEKDPRSLNRAAPSRLPPYLQASRIQNLSRQVLSPDCYKLAVPAILYVIQNNLQYVAATNLDVATFQVTYQMKILTTAFFSVILLRKRLSRAKWIALIMLAVGVGIVQIQSTSTSAHVSSGPGAHASQSGASLRSEIPEESVVIPVRVMHPLRGFIAVTLACMTSGLAGVYFEYILKSSSGSAPPPDLWVRNTQLSLFSLIPALVPILFGGSDDPSLGWLAGVVNKFSHFNGWALGTVLTQTFGGLITAIVIRYSDNIMKGFATSLSIIISFLASVALFSYPITLAFIVGSSIVLGATYIYNSPASQAPSTRTAVAVTPGSPIPTSAPILGEPEKPSRVSSVVNLLGLGSAAPSRQPSSTDLKNSASLGFITPNHHVYAASAPGSPYLSSTHVSSRSSPAPALGMDGSSQERPVLGLDTGK